MASFSTLLDIDKLTRTRRAMRVHDSFSTLLDIDKLTPLPQENLKRRVLVLCWILINLHLPSAVDTIGFVLVLCWILINLHCGVKR